MDTSEINERILNDRTFVTDELENLRQYYELKHTLRWGDNQPVLDQRESVAEHVFGMHLLAEYFLPLHNDLKLDAATITQMITWHDIAEAITRDMTSQTKTDSHRAAEREAEERILSAANPILRSIIRRSLNDYEQQATNEARFTKALDKIEPMFHMYFVTKKPNVAEKNMEWPVDEYRMYRKRYLTAYPLLNAFDDVLEAGIRDSGFFPRT